MPKLLVRNVTGQKKAGVVTVHSGGWLPGTVALSLRQAEGSGPQPRSRVLVWVSPPSWAPAGVSLWTSLCCSLCPSSLTKRPSLTSKLERPEEVN